MPKHQPTTLEPVSNTTSPTEMMRPLLIASLGNPGPLSTTRHSAGHILLRALIPYTNSPLLQKDPAYRKGLTSTSLDGITTFFHSTSYMNDSGPGLASAWRSFLAGRTPASPEQQIAPTTSKSPALIVLHDELELPLGKYKISRGKGKSARGHNGLKSLLAQKGMLDMEFWRVGVGIGPRPVSRDGDVVARFVLGKMAGADAARVEGLAGAVWGELERVRLGG